MIGGGISTDTDNTIDVSINTPQSISTVVTDFCGFNANDTVNILYGPYTPVSITTVSVDSTCAAENVSLTAAATGGIAPYQFLWSNGNSGSTTLFSSTTLGENIVTVTVTDECQLLQSTDMIVDIINCEVNVVNVITPNGDHMNDVLNL